MNEKKPDEKPDEKPEDSPAVKTFNRMVCLTYLLMRDYVKVGEMNGVLKQVLTDQEIRYSDDILKAKAESVADMIGTGKYEVAEIDALWNIRGRMPAVAGSMPDLGALMELMNKHTSMGPVPGDVPGPPPIAMPQDMVDKAKVADSDEGEKG